jgi:phosphoglycolate phosphatase
VLREPIPADSDLVKFIGSPLRDVFRSLLSTTAEDKRIEEAVVAYRVRFADVGLFENAVYEGIPQVLERLSGDARLFVATSKPGLDAKRILEHFGLAHYFQSIYGSEFDGRLSVKSELIAHVVGTAGLNPQETVMVGDRYHDVAGAIQNGIEPAGVLWGHGSREELSAAGAKQLFDTPDELVRIVA